MPEGVKKPDESSKPAVKKTPDLATLGGVLLALGGILGGLLLEGGRIKDIAQITAAIIVLGGTFGAVMVSTPLSVLLGALKRAGGMIIDKSPAPDAAIEELIDYAIKARKNGIVSLEDEASHIPDTFLRKAMTLAIDGTDLQELRHMMELEIDLEKERAVAEAKVFESAGGFAPTIGIIGAVMGLIQVMKNLANIDEVGHGIAVAFVATVYGVGLANILLLPTATKLKSRIERQAHLREMVLQGVIGIVEGLNPKLIRCKLEAYVPKAVKAEKPKKSDAPAQPEPAPAKT